MHCAALEAGCVILASTNTQRAGLRTPEGTSAARTATLFPNPPGTETDVLDCHSA